MDEIVVGTSVAEDLCFPNPTPCPSFAVEFLACESIGSLSVGNGFNGLVADTDKAPVAIGMFECADLAGGELRILDFDSIEIGGNAGGVITLASLPADRAVVIGGPLTGLMNVPAGEFEGQIIANALNDSYAWTGEVRVGSGGGAIRLRPESSQPDQAPYYNRLPSELGGGSVGLVPFRLHDAACDPPAHSDPEDRTFLNSAFCHLVPGTRWSCDVTDPEYAPASIFLIFRGPIKAEDPDIIPVRVYRVNPNGPPDLEVTDMVGFEFHPAYQGGPSRRLEICGKGHEIAQLIAGDYYIVPKRTGDDSLLCDGLLPAAGEVPVAEFIDAGANGADRYEFTLLSDCDRNGVDDAEELSPSTDTDDDGMLDCCEGPNCDPDYNQDSVADQDDIACLIAIISGGNTCESPLDPDFNHTGTADQDDIAALMNTIAGGPCPGDE